MADEGEDPKIWFVVTGFGPFADAFDNPSAALSTDVARYWFEQRQERPQLCQQALTTRVLDTSAEAVRETMDGLYRDMVEEQQRCEKYAVGVTYVYLHLGVNSKGTGFQLEQFAYNNATFRIPDIRGYQPRNEQIFTHFKLDAALASPFSVETLCHNLSQTLSLLHVSAEEEELQEQASASATETTEQSNNNKGSPRKIMESTNPGRYVCNYLYCYSLHKFCQRSPDSDSETHGHLRGSTDTSTSSSTDTPPKHEGTSPPPRCFSLFLHVPPFAVIPHAEQLEFVVALMDELRKQVVA